MSLASLQTTRRNFIRQASLVSLGFLALPACARNRTFDGSPMVTQKLRRDPRGKIDLPPGFSYRVISRSGESMADGLLTPGRPDGMGTFPLDAGRLLIVRNHENSPIPKAHSPFGEDGELLSQLRPEQLYDYGGGEYPSLGGTTTLIYNERTGEVEKQWLSLAGTNRNCAGGITPWGSWLTCEEDLLTAGNPGEKDHGFVFEVPAVATPGLARPEPITAMGRFNHEAVAVDPVSGCVYQTEDDSAGCFYRYVPERPGKLLAGGRLQVLAVKGRPSFDTRNWSERAWRIGDQLPVAWQDVDAAVAMGESIQRICFDEGAARFARGEGIWYGDREFYFACTNGGPGRYGQVMRLRPDGEGGTLQLFAESGSRDVLHMCDNLTVSPWGDLICCEDNGSLNHIKRINRKGQVYNFAVNKGSDSEFAGVVFSPSGETLFVNIQEDGETLAITGPWESLQTL